MELIFMGVIYRPSTVDPGYNEQNLGPPIMILRLG